MSQRGEKYARRMERRTESLEQRTRAVEERLNKHAIHIVQIEADADYLRTMHDNEVDVRRRGERYAAQENRRGRWEFKQAMDRQMYLSLLALLFAIIAMVAVVVTADGKQPETATIQPTSVAAAMVDVDRLAADPVEIDPWAFAALYRAAGDTAEAERIGEALEAQGYFSAAVPLSWEYQDYMRTYCRLYGCPYPLALAVADWETRGQFNMDAVGPAGEVGIMQLNPGSDGEYHAEIEAATGLDPTTPEGNIAGGCYKLGKYMAIYRDPARAAMAYNMGQAGAAKAWEAGTTSTDYTDAVLEAMERWECAVDAWAGE